MIDTERLKIRTLLPDDWADLKSISLDFRASEYAIYDIPLPVEDHEIQPLCEKFAGSGLWYAVCLDEKMIGYICFHAENGSYDLGFCFHSDYHGNGYAYESCSAMLEYMTKERAAKAFTAGTARKNIPSCKLLERLGFILVNTETLSFHKDDNGNDITFEGGIYRKETDR